MEKTTRWVTVRGAIGLGAVLALLMTGAPAGAAKRAPGAAELNPAVAAEVERALNEQRLVDAAGMLDRAAVARMTDPRLLTLAGELDLARGRFANALTMFKRTESLAGERGRSLQGQGIALSLLGRSEDAVAMLEQAVAADPGAWRAWNALGSEYDGRHEFNRADQAYANALAGSEGAASVLNNRGFSLLLRGETQPAIDSFVAALAKMPDLAAARTNLRLALAMKGDYERATAGGAKIDSAALLNNAGFAAMLRGDYGRADALFNDAMRSKGEYYDRASSNLTMSRALAAQDKARLGEPR